MRRLSLILTGVLLIASAASALVPADPDRRAAATEAAMTSAERTRLTHGLMALPFDSPHKLPADAVYGAGYVAGISRLGVPALRETDASLGVAYINGVRKDGATALPSGMAMGATWNPELLRRGGAMIGSEALAKGFNVMLAGGVNLMRDPRNGRTFEYLGEDPLHVGLLGGAAIDGIQSNGIISTIKHFALNDQETARGFVDVRIGEAAARESDLLAFQIAIETGRPGAVMCAYNKINGAPACGNDWLLNQVLKRDWGYRGFVMSDWGAVDSLDTALNGLDQQSGAQLDPQIFFDAPLAAAAARDPAYARRLADMNRRVLRSIFAVGADRPPVLTPTIDVRANADVAEAVAKEAIVLLRNARDLLPLAASARRIAVIGGYADTGVLSGGGSSQVHGEGGPAANLPLGGRGGFVSQQYHRSVPLEALRARAPQTDFVYRDGRYLADAVTAARSADLAIVFATQWMTEGYDVPDLSLPNGQDALIAAVAAANPNTIVVLETGGPVLMPWLDQTAAVLEAWYPGARGAEALAAILYGDTNPSGRLPGTFPASLDQLPRPRLDGLDSVARGFMVKPAPGQTLSVDYDIEGADIGYRWQARSATRPLFPLGFGLSYSRFEFADLELRRGHRLEARFTVHNVGDRAGATVPQLYLVAGPAGATRRLAGFRKIMLAPGEHRQIILAIDERLIGHWRAGGWVREAGSYRFALGDNAESLGPVVTIGMPARRWRDPRPR